MGQPLQIHFSSAEETSSGCSLPDLPPGGLLATGCHGDRLQMPRRVWVPALLLRRFPPPCSGKAGGFSFPSQRPHTREWGDLSFPGCHTLFWSRKAARPCPSMSKVFFGSSFHYSSLSREGSGSPGNQAGGQSECQISGPWPTVPNVCPGDPPLSEICTWLSPSAQHHSPGAITPACCSPEMKGIFRKKVDRYFLSL